MRYLATVWILACFLAFPSRGHADGLYDQVPNSANDPLTILFPNWQLAPVARFDLYECPDGTCPGFPVCEIVSLTLLNHGTAMGGGDLANLYFNIVCGKTDVWATMTYANVWVVEGENRPAWTWKGVIPWAEDPEKGCESYPMLMVYADVASCPTDGATVAIGLGFNEANDPAAPGGVWDNCGNQVPNYDQLRVAKEKYIKYVVKKADKEYVCPADTLTYTIFYGQPGGPSISSFIVFDTLPSYTHYVAGSASIAPDPEWAPKLGPPQRVRWTLPGSASTAGGRTSELKFSVTVDWGNGDSFEPGSGDQAAPEGFRMDNRAAVEFIGSGCAGSYTNMPIQTLVRRYRTWKVADQDLLFAPRLGYNNDEIVYSIFIRNESLKKTWWNVQIWDTVPPELSTWEINQGLNDPLVGWTMSPTGASGDNAGWLETTPGTTLLTWLFDLPPAGTREIRWKAAASTGDCLPGGAAKTKVSIMELGAPGTLNGTGHSGRPRVFTHIAPIALRTTYFSYVGQATNSGGCVGLKINFYPLNKATAFELRKLAYVGDTDPFAQFGGKSASISGYQGTCQGFVDGGYGGCGEERSPAQYFWLNSCPEAPNVALYKLTSNSPLLWILMPEMGGGGAAHTYIPSTSLNFSGFCHYSFRRSVSGSYDAGWGESWVVINTNIDPDGNFNPDLTTTAHIFEWDPVNMKWKYLITRDIDRNSLWMPFDGCTPAEENHYKIISSDARLVVYQGYGTFGDPNIVFAYAEYGTYAPNAESGLNVSRPGEPGTFYAIAHHNVSPHNLIVGNHGAATATYRVYHYRPRNPGLSSQGIPPNLAGSSGSWDLYGTRTADPGFGADSPHVFGEGPSYDPLTAGDGSTANAWKVEWVSGGNISVQTGISMFMAWAGGSTMHPSSGQPTGQEFWLHQANTGPVWAMLLFCPSSGMKVHAENATNDYSGPYTTDGPDQCIFFGGISSLAWGARAAYRFYLDDNGTQGEMMAMYHEAEFREKFFAAPFVNTGLHYDVIAPDSVFSGQSFWLTVAVIMGTGATKPDYTGTCTFTSTDPLAQIAGVPMDLYDYVWQITDEGVRIFINVVLNGSGYVPIVVADTMDGSITGLASIRVQVVDIKFHKEPRYAVAASGDTVQFKICWSNYSTGSASEFVITDAIPSHMTYISDLEANHYCGSTQDLGPPAVAFSSTNNLPASFQDMPSAGTSSPVAWLRWTIPVIGAKTTGCVCFKVKVD